MATSKFTGGDKLKAKLAEISKRIGAKRTLKVGFLEGATYPDENGTPVAQAAFWLNYGTKSAPPRPFFTGMVAANSDAWGDKLGRILERNGWDIDKALKLMGEGIAGQLRDALINLDSPALSPVTLMLRRMLIDNPHLEITGAVVGEAAARVAAGESSEGASTKVGVRTGHMLASIDYEVEE